MFGHSAPFARRIASILCAFWLGATAAVAGTTILEPPVDASGQPLCGTREEFERVANTLEPGDELVLRGGRYCQLARRLVHLGGTADQPIVIRAAAGEVPVLTRPEDPTQPQGQDGIEIFAEHAVLSGLRFEHGNTGVRVLAGSHHLTIENCEISHTSSGGLTFEDGPTDSLIVRRNQIHHTGLLDPSLGQAAGHGILAGGADDKTAASRPVIEQNYLHHLNGTGSADGAAIEIRYRSYGGVVRDNVIHDTNLACIAVYGTADANVDLPNVVEGNAVWNCAEGIRVTSDAVIRNNLVFDSETGIVAAAHPGVPVLRNVSIVHNTVHGHSVEAASIYWAEATAMVLANNAIFNTGGRVASTNGLRGPRTTVSANYVEGEGVAIDDEQFFDGGSASAAFSNPLEMDFWPASGSILVGKADPRYSAAQDFNGAPRGAPHDVGGYETEGQTTNPGWRVVEGFKGEVRPPAAPGNLRAH